MKNYFKQWIFYNDSSENEATKMIQNIYVHIYTSNEYLKIVLKRRKTLTKVILKKPLHQ